MDPLKIQLDEYMLKEDKGVLYVDHAGDILYKLKE
jgi:hypothetical protein